MGVIDVFEEQRSLPRDRGPATKVPVVLQLAALLAVIALTLAWCAPIS